MGMPVVQGLLEALIRDKPDEPFHYIAAFMERLSYVKSTPEQVCDMLAKSGAPEKVGDVVEEPPLHEGLDVVKASPPHEIDVAKAALLSSQVDSGDNIRLRAINVLTEASDNGCLEKALQGVHERRKDKEIEEAAERCRLRARLMLATAATDGRLEKILIQCKEAMTTAPGLLQPLSTAERTRKVLEEAAESGQLEKALKCVCPKVSETKASNPPVS